MKYFKPTRSTFDGINFDSNLEREFYLFLCQAGYNYIVDISVHEPVMIRPASRWFKKQMWKCDFKVKTALGQLFYIEIKGVITAVFREQMKSLALNNQDVFNRLIVITPDKPRCIIKPNLYSVGLMQARTLIEQEDIDWLATNCKKELNNV